MQIKIRMEQRLTTEATEAKDSAHNHRADAIAHTAPAHVIFCMNQ